MNFKFKKFALVLDIETLSVKSNAAISEIALTFINLTNGEVEFVINQNFNTTQQIKDGFDYEDKTIEWLKKVLPESIYNQREKMCSEIECNRNAFLELVQRVNLALKPFAESDFNVYCKGGNFDYPILSNFSNFYLNKAIAFNWGFRQELCMRIFEDMFFNKEELKSIHEEVRVHVSSLVGYEVVPHVAVDDTLMEAEFLYRVYSHLSANL